MTELLLPLLSITGILIALGFIGGAIWLIFFRPSLLKKFTGAQPTHSLAHNLAANLPGLVYRLHLIGDRRMEFFNDQLYVETGLRRDDLSMGELCSLESFILPEDRPRVIRTLKQAIQDGRSFETEYRFQADDQEIRYLLERGTPVYDDNGRPLYIDGVIMNITSRRLLEIKLQESEARYRSMMEAMQEPAYICSTDLHIEYMNPAMIRRIGRNTTGETCYRIMHGFDHPCGWCIMDRVERGDSAEVEVQSPLDGRIFLISNTPLRHANGALSKMTIYRDVTENRQARLAMEAEKERLNVTLQSIGDAVITTDTEGRITLLNPVAESLTGWKQRECIGKPLTEIFRIINEKTRETAKNPVEQVLAKGGIVSLANDTVLIARDGKECIIADSGAPIVDGKGNNIGVVLVFRDMTDEIRFQREIQKTQKLESLNILAGGIAHDYNNVLMGILGNISLAKLNLDPENEIFEILEEAETASLRARDITQQLLSFTRGGPTLRIPCDIVPLLEDAASFALRGSNVSFVIRGEDDLLAVELDRGLLHQAINNIVVNARQAMPEGGEVVIELNCVNLEEEGPLPLPPGKYNRIAISDRGQGIPPENLERIFDLFFTTRPAGSGLGLSTAYSTIIQHQGHLAVESTVGEGSTFIIHLPASQKEILETAPRHEADSSHEGRILIMDDDETANKTAYRMLQEIGFEVETTREGGEAVKRFEEALKEGRPYLLVMLDLTVPGGMGGQEAARHILRLDPGARIIAMSGYNAEAANRDFREMGFEAFLAKPYRLRDIRESLDSVLKTPT